MPRHYVRTSNRGAWSSEDMKNAVTAVLNETMGKNEACRSFDISKPTLLRHLRMARASKNFSEKRLGGKHDLPANLEQDLVSHIKAMSDVGFGFTKLEIRRLAFQLAEANNVHTRFNRQTKLAGIDWFYGFLSRHPDLSVRQTEATSMARAGGFNRPIVEKFFEMLGSVINKHNIGPANLFNVDESGYTTVQRSVPKVVCAKGRKQVPGLTSREKGKNVTAVCCASAAGQFIPPLIIFPRQRMKRELMNGAPPGAIGDCQKNGWIDERLFMVWLKHFASIVRPSPDRKVLLLLDGHVTHTKSLDAIQYCKASGIVLVSLPPHCTHKLQPLDVAYFRPLRTYYDQTISLWLKTHPGKVLSDFEVSGILGIAYGKASSVANAQSGFRKAGIWPLNPLVFEDWEFAPSAVTERRLDDGTGQSEQAAATKRRLDDGTGQSEQAAATEKRLDDGTGQSEQAPVTERGLDDGTGQSEQAAATEKRLDDGTGQSEQAAATERRLDDGTGQSEQAAATERRLDDGTGQSEQAAATERRLDDGTGQYVMALPCSMGTSGLVPILGPHVIPDASEEVVVCSSISPLPVPAVSKTAGSRSRCLVASELTASPYISQLKANKASSTAKGKRLTFEGASLQSASEPKKKKTVKSTENQSKPKKATPPKRSTKKSSNKTEKNGKGEDTTPCGVCSERFCDEEFGRNWIQCNHCLKWFHNECQGLGEQEKTHNFCCVVCENSDTE